MIKDKKKLPTALAEKQELQRQETINKVLRACADIHNEGNKVTIVALMGYTELSRSTFAKPHIRELLVAHGYDFGDNAVVPHKRNKAKQDDTLAEKDSRIAKLREKNAELEHECELLRGKLFLAMQR